MLGMVAQYNTGHKPQRSATLETGAATAVKQPRLTLRATQSIQGYCVLPLTAEPVAQPPGQPEQPVQSAQRTHDDLLREAEAHRALAELFPHLKLNALRAIQDLFPLQAARNAALH